MMSVYVSDVVNVTKPPVREGAWVRTRNGVWYYTACPERISGMKVLIVGAPHMVPYI